MKKISEHLITYTCVSVTLTLIVTCLFNLISHTDIWYYSHWLILIATIAALYAVQFGVVEKIEFKSARMYHLTIFAVWYAGLFAFLFGTGWMGFRIQNIMIFTAVFFLCFILLQRYSRHRIQLQADEINRILKEHQND